MSQQARPWGSSGTGRGTAQLPGGCQDSAHSVTIFAAGQGWRRNLPAGPCPPRGPWRGHSEAEGEGLPEKSQARGVTRAWHCESQRQREQQTRLELRENIPTWITDLPAWDFPSPWGKSLPLSPQFNRVRPLRRGRSGAEPTPHAQGVSHPWSESWTHEQPETPAGLEQRCLKATVPRVDGAQALVFAPWGLCQVLATPGTPTWQVLPVLLLPRHGVRGALRGWAARWANLSGAIVVWAIVVWAVQLPLALCTEGRGTAGSFCGLRVTMSSQCWLPVRLGCPASTAGGHSGGRDQPGTSSLCRSQQGRRGGSFVCWQPRNPCESGLPSADHPAHPGVSLSPSPRGCRDQLW